MSENQFVTALLLALKLKCIRTLFLVTLLREMSKNKQRFFSILADFLQVALNPIKCKLAFDCWNTH